MNIVVADMYYPLMHKELNINLIKCIQSLGDLTIINNRRLYKREDFNNNTTILNVLYFFPKRIELIRSLSIFIHLIFVAFKLKMNAVKYDKIIFLTTNNFAIHYAIKLRLFQANKVVCVHHFDIDKTIASIDETKRFQKSMNLYQHIVFADFIKNGIVNLLGVNPENVIVLPHPVVGLTTNPTNQLIRKYEIIGLGRANDPKFLEQLIALDKLSNKKNKYCIKMRTRGKEYRGKNVELFNVDYLKQEDFDNMLNQAKASIVIYKESYKYRYSGIIVNAMSHGTICICNKIPIGEHFTNICPHNCLTITTPEELFKLADTEFSTFDINEYYNYLTNHSLIEISKILYGLLHP